MRNTGVMLVPLLLQLALTQCASAAVVVGGWDLARGGVESAADAPELAPFRSLIQTLSPGASFTGTNVLTDAYLSTVDLVLLGAQNSNFTHITPLTAAEQTALFNFVIGGGNAVILTEREPQGGPGGDAARESLIDPFGMDTTGDSPAATATFLNPSHFIANGPFGAITQFELNASGWYSNLGPYATAVAVEDTFNQPVLAVIEKDAIAPGSGIVVLLADAHTDYFNQPNLVIGTANNWAHLVPEPSGVVLGAFGLFAILVAMRLRPRGHGLGAA
jgi:hypothetical protein